MVPAFCRCPPPAADQNIIDDTEYSEFQALPTSDVPGGMLRVPSTAATLAPRGTSPPAPGAVPAAAAEGNASPAHDGAGEDDGEEPAHKRQRKAVHWAEQGGEQQQQPAQQQHQWQQQAPPGG